jgi:hypothetical protein
VSTKVRRRTQAERRAVTRRALLDATLDVLAEVGYGGLTTAQVVARAGVTRGAWAHYFATKTELVGPGPAPPHRSADLRDAGVPAEAILRAMPAASLVLCIRRGQDEMADADDVRRVATSLPHVVEIDSDGFDFRVDDKGFVWSYPERTPGKPRVIRTDIAVLYAGDESEKQALLLGEPETFFTTPAYDGLPLVMLRLAQVNVDRLTELVTDAWRMRAPDGLARDLDGTDPG